MSKILLALPLVAILFFANTQKCQAENNDMFNKVIVADTAVYYQIVDEVPVYPGGPEALIKDITDNFKYSGEFKGRAIIQLKIGYDGVVRDVDLIRANDENLKEALRQACKKIKKFTPGKQGGKAVNAMFMLPLKI